jgi:argininosuccinate synthase
VALDGRALAPAELIRAVDVLGGAYGFGRVDMIENRRVGIKSRELYEVPGALALITAHRALEDLTLEREVAHFKPGIERRWADLVYDGHWHSPLRRALDAFIDATQSHVTGEVRLEFSSGACAVVGRRSDAALYDLSLATYGSEDAFDQSHARGFVRLWGLPLRVWATKQGGA